MIAAVQGASHDSRKATLERLLALFLPQCFSLLNEAIRQGQQGVGT
jgi:hypothetical protein